jgi:hypothetical protein
MGVIVVVLTCDKLKLKLAGDGVGAFPPTSNVTTRKKLAGVGFMAWLKLLMVNIFEPEPLTTKLVEAPVTTVPAPVA